MDRYNHDMGGEDTDDTDDFPLIGSFGSYSPQYRKNNSSLVQINLPPQSSLDDSVNTSSGTASPLSLNHSQSGINTSAVLSAAATTTTTTIATTNSNIGKIMSTPQLRKLDVSCKLFSFTFSSLHLVLNRSNNVRSIALSRFAVQLP